MKPSILIKNAKIVTDGNIYVSDIYLKNGIIEKIQKEISIPADKVIDAQENYVLPGVIDDQVHFREPGLTHKADIYTESRAAVAGGVTTFMEMPNTVPNTVTQERLEEKYKIASQTSLANYSFFFGATNNNLSEVLKTNPKNVCGIKVFMGSSTGNMLVDNEEVLKQLFSQCNMLIASHCEDEQTIRDNVSKYRERYGEAVPIEEHPNIRSAEACYLSSSKAVALAKETGARLHVLHISTEKETHLFSNDKSLKEKKITAEACIHHLWFNNSDYKEKGTFIKWNPAVKTEEDRKGVWKALLDDRIDIIATDHAPHTIEEKQNTYFDAPSGGPLAQHGLPAMLDKVKDGTIGIEKVVEKMCHNPAILFEIEKRGFIREGYHADLVVVDTQSPWKVSKSNILYKCGWSPFENHEFSSSVTHTIVSGHLAYEKGKLDNSILGERILFDR